MYKAKMIPVILCVLVILTTSRANDILGCGGFVKSHINLDYSKIEIALYTKEGTLKEKTECAPTNGYYFLPLYEKGEYRLKIHPPPGWSFEPSIVELSVDGVNDQCSSGHDINFAFNGFGIAGRVNTAGMKLGPSGISVQLVDEKGGVRNTITSVGGDFHFTPVIPGKYIVKASHPRWKLEPGQAVVQVKEGNTALPGGVLTVKGYDVKGSITSFGSPIAGLYVLLYSKEESPKFRVEGCKTALLQGVPDSPICYSVTDTAGEFAFGLVPAGEYKLLALTKSPGQAAISYNIKPETVSFNVQHDSLYIKNSFEVTGYNVVGTVLASTGGPGIAGARVLLDGKPVGNTDKTGKYTLSSLKPGVYTVTFEHEECEMEAARVSVGAAGGVGGATRAVAVQWRVCGAVSPLPRDVTLYGDHGSPRTVQVTADDGNWCTFLPPGVYTAKIEVSEQEMRDGLQFYPLSQKVSVGHSSVSGVVFSQLKARVWGRVSCTGCFALSVTLRTRTTDGAPAGPPVTTTFSETGTYSFSSVLPGLVEVSVDDSRICWENAVYTLTVAQAEIEVPPFVQRGYRIRVHSEHDIQVDYKSENSQGSLSVPAGASQQCLEHAERYILVPRGCHQFQPPQITVDTSLDSVQTVYFVAIAHAVVVRVVSPEFVTDLMLTVTTEREGEKQVGPVKLVQQADGNYVYEHIMYMIDGESGSVSARSGSLLWSGGNGGVCEVSGGAQCQPHGCELRGRRAVSVSGRVLPPVADVTITIVSDDLKLTYVTGEDGTYKFGPLDSSKLYTVTAEKDSYVLSSPDQNGNIMAHKLAEILVELVDDADDTPLQGALVSVSGGQYRRNVVAGADGRLRFGSLAPAQYYAKPLMKEYRFTPAHALVDVLEGRTHNITLRGVRVAWSCIGSLVSLAGVGFSAAVVLAVPLESSAPHCAPEEATTDVNGAFRIRGLLPKCSYTVQLKPSSSPELVGLKLVKAPSLLEVSDKKDIKDVLLVGIQPPQLADGAVLVRTSGEHARVLRLSVDSWTARLDSPPGFDALRTTPRVAPGHHRLRLTSSLSRSTHHFDDVDISWNADGRYRAFTLDFHPKVRSSEQELKQPSFLVVPLLAALVIAYLRRDQLLTQLMALMAPNKTRIRPDKPDRPDRADKPDRVELLDKPTIDQIVSTVNATGRRTKKKFI